jgi:anti-sigma regulatory factor (Ser/Thr protein kinase)
MKPEIAAELPAAEPAVAAPAFTVRLSSTRRGARLARRLAVQQIESWGVPYGGPTATAVASVTAELAANAATHGRVPGRDFALTLLRLPEAIRIEVTDARPERHPVSASSASCGSAAAEQECGRGLLLVEAFADRWGYVVRDACTKTVWAEVTLLCLL